MCNTKHIKTEYGYEVQLFTGKIVFETNETYLKLKHEVRQMKQSYHLSSEQYNDLNQQMLNVRGQMVVFDELLSMLYEEK